MAAKMCQIWSEPGHQIGQFSAKQLGAAAQDEVALRVHGVIQLSMGIEREDRCE